MQDKEENYSAKDVEGKNLRDIWISRGCLLGISWKMGLWLLLLRGRGDLGRH